MVINTQAVWDFWYTHVSPSISPIFISRQLYSFFLINSYSVQIAYKLHSSCDYFITMSVSLFCLHHCSMLLILISICVMLDAVALLLATKWVHSIPYMKNCHALIIELHKVRARSPLNTYILTVSLLYFSALFYISVHSSCYSNDWNTIHSFRYCATPILLILVWTNFPMLLFAFGII